MLTTSRELTSSRVIALTLTRTQRMSTPQLLGTVSSLGMSDASSDFLSSLATARASVGGTAFRHLQWLASAWAAEEVRVREALNPRGLPHGDRPVLCRMHGQGPVTGYKRPRYVHRQAVDTRSGHRLRGSP